MYWHPLLLAVISAEVVALFLLLKTAITSFRIVLHWQPASADSRQLSLEAAAESASILGRAAFWLMMFAAVLLIYGIANVFHEDIPGAMCGTGVCQAMSGNGRNLLLFTGLLLLVMQIWYEMEKLNRLQVDIPMTQLNARMFLVIPPVAVLTLLHTYEAFAGIQPHRPVDCCALVYDQFTSLEQTKSVVGIADMWWVITFLFMGSLLLCLSIFMSTAAGNNRKMRIITPLLSLLWLPVAATTLVNVLSAYHYEVLNHRCPWCLFLPEHGLVGYPLYGLLWFIGLEGLTILLLPRLVSENDQTNRHALDRCLRAAKRIAIAEIIFLVFALTPAVIWRVRFGVWMTT